MTFNIPAKAPLDYSSRKRSKADFVVELADFVFLLWVALDGFEPEPGAYVTIEVAARKGDQRMVNLCDAVVRALEWLGIDPAKFDKLQYKRGKVRRDQVRITFK